MDTFESKRLISPTRLKVFLRAYGGVFRKLKAAIVVAILLSDSVYRVDPADMARLQRLGVTISTQLVGPGLHFKLPLIDQVQRLRVSATGITIDDLRVYTLDNQRFQISLGMTYQIPPDAVPRLMDRVTIRHKFSVRESVTPILAEEARRIAATRSSITISMNRDVLADEIRVSVSTRLAEQFGLQTLGLQITQIEPSPELRNSDRSSDESRKGRGGDDTSPEPASIRG